MKQRTAKDLQDEFGDELRGLLLESFAEARNPTLNNMSAKGSMMFQQLVRARELLERIHLFYCPKPAEVTPEMKKEEPKPSPQTNGVRK